MLFKVVNNNTGRSTHCGVLEFVAQEGHVYLPRWVSSSSSSQQKQHIRG
jgi:ubiquitin fusion degradation protein 1